MKKRYFWMIGIVVFLVLLWISWSIFTGPVNRVNKNIPPSLLFQNRSIQITSGYLIGENSPINNNMIHQQKDSFYCKPSGEKAKKIEYYYHSEGAGVTGGWYYRYAVICGKNYWVVDGDDSFGQKVYGPFQK